MMMIVCLVSQHFRPAAPVAQAMVGSTYWISVIFSMLARRRELSDAVQLANGHMSIYELTLKEGTAFHRMFK